MEYPANFISILNLKENNCVKKRMQGFVKFTVIQKILLFLSINFLLMSSAKCESKTSLEFEYLQKHPILSAPLITPLQEELILEAGSNFTLRCDSDKEIHWAKWDKQAKDWIVTNNVVINGNNELRPYRSLLPLVDVSAKDVGTYYCVNKILDVSEGEQIEKNDYNAVGIYIYVKDKKNIIIAEESFYLEQNVRWLIPCKPAEPSTEILLTLIPNKNIVIANSTAMIAGEWKIPTIDGILIKQITFNPRKGFMLQSNDLLDANINCTGLNSAHIESKILDVVIDSYLDVTAPGSYYVDSIVNHSIHLVANVDGFPLPTIDWYNWKGEKIEASEKYHFTEEGNVRTLEIRSAKLFDAGIYTLKSSNGIEVRNLSYDVQVFDVPKVEMSDTYIRVNEEARLMCKVTSNTPARVTFILTNCSTIPHWPTCFNTSDRIVIENPQPGNSNFEYLYLYNFTPSVPTKVRCVVSNMITPIGKPETANAYIFLSDFEPYSNMTVLRSDGHRELIKGDDLHLVCSAMVYHLAKANLQWYRNDELLKDEPGVIITSSLSNYTVSKTLTIPDMQVGNVTLECRAPYTNNLTSPMHVMHMEIIKEPVFPNITNTNINSTIIKYKISDTLNLQCKGNGVPQPTVKWLKDGVELQASDKVQFDADNSTLTIPFLGSQDEGTYKCVVSNRLGQVETYTELQISGKSVL